MIGSIAGCDGVRGFGFGAGVDTDGGISDGATVEPPGTARGSHTGKKIGRDAGPRGAGGARNADAALDATPGYDARPDDDARHGAGGDGAGRGSGGDDSGGHDSGGRDAGGHDVAGHDAGRAGTAGRGPSTGSGGSWSACSSNGLQISYNPMYSAYVDDPSITFRFPAVVNAGSGAPIVWTASDPSMVRFEITGPGAVMITTAKAGDVTIEAEWNGACGTAPLHITAATKAQWLAGKQRYDNGNPLPPVQTDPTTGFPVQPPGGFPQTTIDPPGHPPACTSCHGDKPTSSFFKAPSPEPRLSAGFSDQDLAAIITQAAVPMAAYYDESLMPRQYWPFFHRWSDISSADDVKAMVVYLRSLPATAQSGP